jgi:transposase
MVCKLYNRSDRMVRLWVHLFNDGGIDALITKPRPGRPPKVKTQRLKDLLVPVLEDPAKAGQLHWTGVKLHGWLNEQLEEQLGYSTTLRYLHKLGYNLRVPRPWPERQDESLREAFLEKVRPLQDDPSVQIWFGDECGVEGDPRPSRRWVARGSRPKIPYYGEHLRSNVVGAVCPQTGECFSMIYNGVNTEVFQHWLDAFAQQVPKAVGTRHILVLDNASWHKAKRLKWHHFEPMYLPPYSPDYNPIERLWLRMKADFFSNFIAKTPDQLNARLIEALCHFMGEPEIVASQCSFRK